MTTPEQIRGKVTQRQAEREAVVDLWRSFIPSYCPAPEQFNVWLEKHALPIVCYGIRETGAKYARVRGQMNESYLLRFASKVMVNKQARGLDRQLRVLTMATR